MHGAYQSFWLSLKTLFACFFINAIDFMYTFVYIISMIICIQTYTQKGRLYDK